LLACVLIDVMGDGLSLVYSFYDPALARRSLGTFIVLDNHESDRALARFLETLRGCPVTFLVTARRCLLAGVEIFPVVPPLVTSGRSAFTRVAALTSLLRWNPLALDIADGLIGSGAVSLSALRRFLVAGGVERVSVMKNEDDVAEVRLLGGLAHSEGDDVDGQSLAEIARVPRGAGVALRSLQRFRLVQEPLAGRFTVHAVVRQAVQARTKVPRERYFRHYVRLLERFPERVDLEQTHLFAAMDHAHTTSDLPGALRLGRLLDLLEPARPDPD